MATYVQMVNSGQPDRGIDRSIWRDPEIDEIIRVLVDDGETITMTRLSNVQWTKTGDMWDHAIRRCSVWDFSNVPDPTRWPGHSAKRGVIEVPDDDVEFATMMDFVQYAKTLVKP